MNPRPDLCASDVRQFEYCPRVVFFRRALPFEVERTEKMDHGALRHQTLERLEKRRVLTKYGLDAAERRFEVRLHDARLAVSGRVDILLVRTADRTAYPVDIKCTEHGVSRGHRLQVVAYGLLVERTLGLAVPRCFIYLDPAGEVVDVPMSPLERREVLRLFDNIGVMIRSGAIPPGTDHLGKCGDCEFRRFCNDRF